MCPSASVCMSALIPVPTYTMSGQVMLAIHMQFEQLWHRWFLAGLRRGHHMPLCNLVTLCGRPNRTMQVSLEVVQIRTHVNQPGVVTTCLLQRVVILFLVILLSVDMYLCTLGL